MTDVVPMRFQQLRELYPHLAQEVDDFIADVACERDMAEAYCSELVAALRPLAAVAKLPEYSGFDDELVIFRFVTTGEETCVSITLGQCRTALSLLGSLG